MLRPPHSFTLFPYTTLFRSVLKLRGERIRHWVELGLLRPTETAHGVHYFDFRQASWARSLCDFMAAGVAPRRIRQRDRKSTRLNSSHRCISYAVFCLKKKIS